MGQVALAGDHDALGLGRARAVEGLGAVAHGGGAQGEVLDEPQDAQAVLSGHPVHALQVLLHVGAQLLVPQVGLGGGGDHQAAGNVLRQPGDLVGIAGDVLLTDVGQQQVDDVVAALRGVPLGGAGDAAAVQRLVQVGHLDEFVLDVAGLGRPVVVGRHRRRADEHVAHAHLAPAVTLAVIAGEALHHHAGELRLPVEEDALVGDEHVVKDHQGLHPAELRVAHVHLAALPLPGVAALPADDHEDALRVDGHGEGHGVVLVVGAHGDGGHDDDLVAVQRAGLVGLGPPHHDAVRPPLHHTEEQVRVALLVGGLGPVPLGIGHGAVHRQVVLLTVDHEFLEVLVVAGAALLVGLVGGGEHGVERVHAHAALEAGGGLLAQQALHLHLLDQVPGGLMDVGEAVHPLPGIGGDGGHQVLILRHLRQVIGHAHAVQRRPQDGVVHGVLHLLPEHVYLHVQLPDGFDVLFAGHE